MPNVQRLSPTPQHQGDEYVLWCAERQADLDAYLSHVSPHIPLTLSFSDLLFCISATTWDAKALAVATVCSAMVPVADQEEAFGPMVGAPAARVTVNDLGVFFARFGEFAAGFAAFLAARRRGPAEAAPTALSEGAADADVDVSAAAAAAAAAEYVAARAASFRQLVVRAMPLGDARRRSAQFLARAANGVCVFVSGRHAALSPALLAVLGVTRVVQCYSAKGDGGAGEGGSGSDERGLTVVGEAACGPYTVQHVRATVGKRAAPHRVARLVVPALDAPGYDLGQHFNDAVVRFALLGEGSEGSAGGSAGGGTEGLGNVLIHCSAGKHRGPAVAAAVLLAGQRLRLIDAWGDAAAGVAAACASDGAAVVRAVVAHICGARAIAEFPEETMEHLKDFDVHLSAT